MYTPPKAVKSSATIGKVQTIAGYICAALFLLALLIYIFDSDTEVTTGDYIVASSFLAISVLLIIKGIGNSRRISRFKWYLILIYEQRLTSLEEIAERSSKTVEFVKKDLQKMIDMHFFIDLVIDATADRIALVGGTAAYSRFNSTYQQILSDTGADMEPYTCPWCGAPGLISKNGIGMCEYCNNPIYGSRQQINSLQQKKPEQAQYGYPPPGIKQNNNSPQTNATGQKIFRLSLLCGIAGIIASIALVLSSFGIYLIGLILGVSAILFSNKAKSLGVIKSKVTAGWVIGIIGICLWTILLPAVFEPYLDISSSEIGRENLYQSVSLDEVGISMEFPGDWIEGNGNPDAVIEKMPKAAAASVFVIAEPRDHYIDSYTLDEYAEIVAMVMKENISSEAVPELIDVKIGDDIPAIQFELSGNVEGLKVRYMITCFEGDEYFYQIYAWSQEFMFDGWQLIFDDILSRVSFI